MVTVSIAWFLFDDMEGWPITTGEVCVCILWGCPPPPKEKKRKRLNCGKGELNSEDISVGNPSPPDLNVQCP